MGPEALALFACVLITLAISTTVLLVLREDVKRVQQGLTNLTNVNTRTNIYAQKAIAASARQAGALAPEPARKDRPTDGS